MADEIKIQTEHLRVSLARSGAAIDALLRAHVDDVTDEIQSRAREMAPRGPTGRLKTEGIIGSPVIEGTVTAASAFGGGLSIRGATGFAGSVFDHSPGDKVYTARVQLNPEVKHAKWVHEGTGLFGPYHSPIIPRRAKYLVFYWHGRKWQKRSVKGQRAQPFLTESYEYVRSVYEPAKLSELRAEIAAVT